MASDFTLVTGGAGFIGSTLCKALFREGRPVAILDNLSFGRRELLEPLPKNCEFIQGDLRDESFLRETLRKFRPRHIFHLAALHFIPYCSEHPVETVDVNVNGTRNLLRACRETPPELIFFASTAAVYPIEGSPFTETHPVGPLDIYGYSKLAGEDLMRLFHLETGVRSLVVRFFNAFGPNETNPHLVPEIIRQLHQGNTLRLGNLDPVRDYIHTEDMVSALLLLRDRSRENFDVVNLGTGDGYSVRGVVAAFEEALGRRLEIVQESARVRKVERQTLLADAAKLRRLVGWEHRVSFREGVRKLVEAESLAK